MRALVFDLSLVKYALARIAGPRARRLHYGPGSCFQLREVEAPRLPSDEWVVLAPRMTGFCGTDLASIFFKVSPALSALSIGAGEKAVFGHEVLADVVHVGSAARGRGFAEGDRVVVDPVLACDARGLERCDRCTIGEYATCSRAGIARPKGLMLGACSAYPGGFGERMVAHRSQVFRVPDAVPDDVAVLTEPLAIGAHAVLRHPPAPGEDVLVIGGGMIAFSLLWALREMHPQARTTLFTVEPYQLDLARSLGATQAWSPAGGTLLDQAKVATRSEILRPVIGRPFLSGGFRRVYDCVGSRASLDDALRVTGGGGTIVMVGAAGEVPKIDLTFLWQKELRLEGTVFYADESWRGRRARTFEAVLELLGTTEAPLASLVTHRFPLERYADAIEVNLDRRAHRSVKAVFTL